MLTKFSRKKHEQGVNFGKEMENIKKYQIEIREMKNTINLICLDFLLLIKLWICRAWLTNNASLLYRHLIYNSVKLGRSKLKLFSLKQYFLTIQ